MDNRMITAFKDNSRELLLLLLYTSIVVFFCSKMSPFYPIQEWSDVNLYFNVSKAMIHGQTLYAESFDHKGPVIFLIYGIGYLISNDSFLGLFFIQILTWTALVFIAYFISRLFLNKIYSFITAAFFLLLFISHTLEGGSAEEFVTLFMAVSFYLFIRYFKDPHNHSLSDMYIHGLMWGLVFYTKFNLVIFWVFPLLGIGVILLLQKRYKNLLQNVGSFLLGVLTITLPFALYFIIKGALSEAIDVYFLLNSSSKIGEIGATIHKIVISFYQRLRFETVEFVVILLGAFLFPIIYLKNNIAKISIALCFLSLFAMIFIGGYVYYYSIPYYLFTILGCISIAGFIYKFVRIKREWIYICVVLIITISGSIYRKNFFDKFITNRAPNVIDTFLPIILQEEDRSLINLGLNETNALFTYANILPNTKYFIAPNLPYEVFPELREEQAKYIEEGKTQFVILTEYTLNADYFLNFQPLKENYDIVEKFEEYYAWNDVNRYYYLYKRKEKSE